LPCKKFTQFSLAEWTNYPDSHKLPCPTPYVMGELHNQSLSDNLIVFTEDVMINNGDLWGRSVSFHIGDIYR